MNLFVQIYPQPDVLCAQSFEGLVEAMQGLPGMYFEMDGSFVWVDHICNPAKQMDAMVYDRDGRLAYVEVKGDCSPYQWLLLCRAICMLPVEPSELLSKPSEGAPLWAMLDTVL
ncbi:MAG: hypothetical protein ACOVQM_15890, partial [Pirellula sp.]